MDGQPPPIVRPASRAGSHDFERMRRGVLAGVLLMHAAGVVLLDRLLRRGLPPSPSVPELVFEVRFLEPGPPVQPEPAATPVVPAAPRDAPARIPPRTVDAADRGVAVQFLPPDPAPPSVDSRRLFDPNGRVQLPDGLVAREAPPERSPMDPPRRMIPDQRTRFDAAWKPDGENLAQEAVRKVPLLGLILQGANTGPNCPPNSTDPRCEATTQEQRARIPPTPQSGRQPW